MKPLADICHVRLRPLFLWRGVAVALAIVIGVFFATGCSNTQGSGDHSLGAQALQNLSPFEMRVLKDKHVSQAEFDESMQVYTECLTAAGLKYHIQSDQAGMGAVQVTGTGAPSMGSDSAMERCVHQVDAVQEVWILQNHVSASDVDKLQAKFISCLRGAGLSIKDGASFADAENAVSQFTNSLPEHYDNNSPDGIIAGKADTCQQDYYSVSGAQPLPGLQEALDNLDTSGW